MSDVTSAVENLRKSVGLYHEQRVTNLLDAQREALSTPLTTDEIPWCLCATDDCQQDLKDPACPVMEKALRMLLPVILKRIGAEATP